MKSIRTDLAVERTAGAPALPGITQETRGTIFSITEIRIANDICGAPIGKPAGRYVTLEAEALNRNHSRYQEMAEELAEDAVLAREDSGFGGVRAIVRRDAVPACLPLEKPTVEDIILAMVRKEQKR